jgi:putative endonuclease
MYYVYILCSKKNGTLYTGVINNIIRRVYEHKNKLAEGFTRKYSIDKLVYYELHESIELAILREKQIKHWKRCLRIELIVIFNPNWKDLYADII